MSLSKNMIQEKIDTIAKTFNSISAEVTELTKSISEKQDELKRLQGEYRAYVVLLEEINNSEISESEKEGA